MKLTDMFPRKYASGDDLAGKPITLTITNVRTEKMRPQPAAPEQTKYVVYFENAGKGVILSRTLAYQIANIAGSEDTADWTGKRITLHPVPMTVAGKKRVAIRARAPKPGNGTAPPPATMTNEEDL